MLGKKTEVAFLEELIFKNSLAYNQGGIIYS